MPALRPVAWRELIERVGADIPLLGPRCGTGKCAGELAAQTCDRRKLIPAGYAQMIAYLFSLKPCSSCCSWNRLIFSSGLLAMAVSGRIPDQFS